MDINSSSVSLDPIQNFPTEIVEMIFNHFRGKELLQNSTVNWFWNDHIGTSKRCMKKLKLWIGSDRYKNFTKHDKESLVISRAHQNIRISEASDMIDYIYDILSSQSDWKSVTIVDTEFESTASFMDLLKIFVGTVETLGLYRVTVKVQEETKASFEFKELKNLTICKCDEFIFMDIFLQCPALTTLQIYSPKKTFNNPCKIIKLLKRHEGIKKFQTDGTWFNFIFSANNENEVPEISFKLEKLSIFGSGLLINRIDEVFLKFLRSQLSLTSLHLGDCLGCNVNVLETTLELKSLANLSLFFLPIGLEYELVDLPKSASIESLDMLTIDIDNKEKMKFILKSVPRVKNLRLKLMDEETARFMAAKLKCLEKILTVYLKDAEVVRELLPSVRII